MKKTLPKTLLAVSLSASMCIPATVMAAPKSVSTDSVSANQKTVKLAESESTSTLNMSTEIDNSVPQVGDTIKFVTTITGMDQLKGYDKNTTVTLKIPLPDSCSYVNGGSYDGTNHLIKFNIPLSSSSTSLAYQLKAEKAGTAVIGKGASLDFESMNSSGSKTTSNIPIPEGKICSLSIAEASSKTNPSDIPITPTTKSIQWSADCNVSPETVKTNSNVKVSYTLTGDNDMDNVRIVLTPPESAKVDTTNGVQTPRVVTSKESGQTKWIYDIQNYKKGTFLKFAYTITPQKTGKYSASDINIGLLTEEQFKDQALTDETTSAQKWVTASFSKDHHYEVTESGTKSSTSDKNDATKTPKYEIVETLINDIPDKVTLDDENTVSNARKEFDDLSEDEKVKVANYDRLLNAEQDIRDLKNGKTPAEHQKTDTIDNSHTDIIDPSGEDNTVKTAEDVISMIDGLPTIITKNDAEAVQNTRSAYDGLSKEEQDKVTNYNKLLNAEKQLQTLNDNNSSSASQSQTITAPADKRNSANGESPQTGVDDYTTTGTIAMLLAAASGAMTFAFKNKRKDS